MAAAAAAASVVPTQPLFNGAHVLAHAEAVMGLTTALDMSYRNSVLLWDFALSAHITAYEATVTAVVAAVRLHRSDLQKLVRASAPTLTLLPDLKDLDDNDPEKRESGAIDLLQWVCSNDLRPRDPMCDQVFKLHTEAKGKLGSFMCTFALKPDPARRIKVLRSIVQYDSVAERPGNLDMPVYAVTDGWVTRSTTMVQNFLARVLAMGTTALPVYSSHDEIHSDANAYSRRTAIRERTQQAQSHTEMQSLAFPLCLDALRVDLRDPNGVVTEESVKKALAGTVLVAIQYNTGYLAVCPLKQQ